MGAGAFATVAPLQLWVLQKAGPAGQGLASSLNIAAFNLGNALGAWIGAELITFGFGLTALPPVAAVVTGTGLVVALLFRPSDRPAAPPLASCGHEG